MFYLHGFKAEYPFVVVACPACCRVHEVSKEAWLTKRWSVQCEACGGTFGVGSPEEVERFVVFRWTDKKSPEPVYVDFFIVKRGYITQGRAGEISFHRWHGWVDRSDRHIVQEG